MELPAEISALRKQMQTAWRKGHTARREGKELRDNPYAISHMTRSYRKWWNAGWDHANTNEG